MFNFQSKLSVRILRSPQKCVCIPQNAATDPLIALSLSHADVLQRLRYSRFPWQKPTKKTVPLFLVIMHLRRTFSTAQFRLLCPYKGQEQINRSSLTPSANTTVLIQFHGIRMLHPATSAVYIYSGSKHTHTYRDSHIRIVFDVRSMYGINQ